MPKTRRRKLWPVTAARIEEIASRLRKKLQTAMDELGERSPGGVTGCAPCESVFLKGDGEWFFETDKSHANYHASIDLFTTHTYLSKRDKRLKGRWKFRSVRAKRKP